MLEELALRCAERDMIGLLAWQSAGSESAMRCGIAIAGPGASGPWYANASSGVLSELHAQLMPSQSIDAWSALVDATPDGLERAVIMAHAPAVSPVPHAGPGFAIICVRPGSRPVSAALLDVVRATRSETIWMPGEVRAQRERWQQRGIPLLRREFDALAAAGAALFVPPAREQSVLREGADPLKVF